MSEATYLNERVIIKIGNITRENVNAVVNAANWTLLGGGGVDGAIHDAGGEEIMKACEEIRKTKYPKGLPTGKAVITTAGKLPAKFVIHTVGPIRGIDKENEAGQLANCYRNSLQIAVDNNLETIAFPAISTGAYGYPKHEAAEIASKTIKDFLAENEQIKEVILIFFLPNEAKTFIRHQLF
jgi:O-acetyl-ADP-ribose deacetylase